ncbi:polyketide cyclase [Chromatiales bacterium (ex Bugula neritina AB1)]|nr:polyketide cyclase [Chromatiales bacterium (ex Bugula neritina AB1)]
MLEGFDSKWADFPDYILGITREIWEQRQIHTLHHYYAEDIVVRSPGSVVIGNKGVIGATMATLAELPDRELLGEDVIWCGDADTGYLSSHRILTTATHNHAGVYGQPTGKKLAYRVIADCAARNNQIYDEWLIRDQGAIVRQLGVDPTQYARDLIEAEGGAQNCIMPLTPDTDQNGDYQGQGNDNEWGQRYVDTLKRIMNAEMSVVNTEYDRACHLELPGGVSAHGMAAADKFWMGLRASFPDATFSVDHSIGREDNLYSPRAAVRWSLHGKHKGWGTFGAPTGAEVYVLGISHAEYGPYGLRREWVLFDETAIWKQIVLKTG